MRVAVLYTTFADMEEARSFAQQAVEAGLAACVNAFPGMQSLYTWEGELRAEGEVAAIVKSRPELKERLMAFAREHHPYDTPALLWFETSDADPDFAAWVGEMTGA